MIQSSDLGAERGCLLRVRGILHGRLRRLIRLQLATLSLEMAELFAVVAVLLLPLLTFGLTLCRLRGRLGKERRGQRIMSRLLLSEDGVYDIVGLKFVGGGHEDGAECGVCGRK